MAEHQPDASRATDSIDRVAPPRTPAWVKALALLAALLVLIIVVISVTGGVGSHGPGRHGG